LPHVYVDHGIRVKTRPPYDAHRFFFVQKRALRPSVRLLKWLGDCSKLETTADRKQLEQSVSYRYEGYKMDVDEFIGKTINPHGATTP
jgi:hypothetical protein